MKAFTTLLLILILSTFISYGQTKKDSCLISQETKQKAFLFLNGTNICFYDFVAEQNSVFAYHPSLAVNLGSKINISSKMAFLISIGILQKNFDYNKNVLMIHQSNKLDIQNEVKSFIGVVGLERRFNLSKNITFNIGSGLNLKYDMSFKSIRNYLVTYQMDSFYWHFGKSVITTNGNVGLGLNINSGFNFMVSRNFGINVLLQYSYYKYFNNPVSVVKTNDIDKATGIETYTENTFSPKEYIDGETIVNHNQFIRYDKDHVFHTGGSNFFGNSDFIISTGIIYKIK